MTEGTSAQKRFQAGQKIAGHICGVCQSPVLAGEIVVLCPDCNRTYHDECWDDNRGCAVYGCPAAPATEKPDGVVTDEPSNVWGGEKQCPACRRTIKARALKCRFCGAEFDTRDAITAEEYRRREYEGREYVRARNLSILIFLLSGAGCLSVVGLVMALMVIYGDSMMEYRRLPSALKAVVWSAVGVSLLLLCLAVLFMILD